MIKYEYNDDHVIFTNEDESRGLSRIIRYFSARNDEPKRVDDWVAGDAARCDALAALRRYEGENPNTLEFEEDRIIAQHSAIATFTAGQARALGLPARPPYIFSTDVSGVLGASNFKLVAHWLEGNQRVSTRRKGAFLETADGTFLIPAHVFSAIRLIEEFDRGPRALDHCWDALARFRRLLEPQFDVTDPAASMEGRDIEMSQFLENLRIYTGTALSLRLLGPEDDIDFDPIIYDAETIETAQEEGRTVKEDEGTLSSEDLDSLLQNENTGFRAFSDAKNTYLLGNHTYLIVDDEVKVALQVVREMQQASPSQKRAFATNPRAFIADRIAQELGDIIEEELEERMESLFWETPEYADRAFGIGLWERPNLDMLSPAQNDWLPEVFPLHIGDVSVQVHRDAIPTLRAQIDEAIEAGVAHIEYEGHQIPATEAVRQQLAEFIGVERPIDLSPEDEEGDEPAEQPPAPTVVLVYENFVEENWRPDVPPRDALISPDEPRGLDTALMAHQQEALKWQIEAWREGQPGVLNADDQGLGKTVQTLAFLRWLQSNMDEGSLENRHPILIVAPRGLISTWKKEHETHLSGTGLGPNINVYGSGLTQLRKPGHRGRDTDDGEPRLHFPDMESAVENGKGHRWWLLTTYETLANYQHSFRRFNFSVVVFDEIQKIKNPQTLAALATRSVRADFRIGLTGTPMENHVADLWAVMDAIAPGRLGTLQDYLAQYQDVTEEKMSELHARLFKPTLSEGHQFPPIAQRRFKQDNIENLPRKDYRVYPMIMPEIQASAYDRALVTLRDGARGVGFKLLHRIRGVSLHPESPYTLQTDIDTYFSNSARFEATRNILNRIRERNERVLLFTEDRQMQAFIAQWLRSEYGLLDVPIINGATSNPKRQEYVERFQAYDTSGHGFAAMILSPRSAGVGLTLTAATHVIHLSRWWNPAVEEQCNDRIYRIGQTRNVMVHIPLAVHPDHQERSFDCVLNNLMRRKQALAHRILWPQINTDEDTGTVISDLYEAVQVNVDEIDKYSWEQFEHWVMERARDSGDWDVSATPRSGDAGADVVLRHRRRSGVSALVQVKHRSDRQKPLEPKSVEEIIGAKKRYEVSNPQLLVITNASEFSGPARQLALENDVILLTRDRLSLWPNHVVG